MTHAGFSVLMAACANEDSDPRVVKTILDVFESVEDVDGIEGAVNYRMRSQTIKWKMLRGTAKVLVRGRLVRSALVKRLANGAGLTALHYAVRRGDVEIVKILLDAGADPFVKNDLGANAFEYCDRCGPYPSVKKVLLENSLKE